MLLYSSAGESLNKALHILPLLWLQGYVGEQWQRRT